KLIQDLNNLEGGRTLVLSHPHTDVDGLGSILGLGEILKSMGVEVTKGVPTGLDDLSKRIIDHLDQEIDIIVDPPTDFDFIFVVDTSSFEHLKEYEEKIRNSDAEKYFVDHHRVEGDTLKQLDGYYIDEESTSTAELVLELGDKLDFEFNPPLPTLLLTGIVADTAHFRFANERTFKSVTSLLEKGADYREVLDMLQTEEDRSKRIAKL
ncbi:MAG: bifunctional oligoribonuclease/PAP phosphatase NrnA, partial [Candidatus Aenigmatarchaeota archaeon]